MGYIPVFMRQAESLVFFGLLSAFVAIAAGDHEQLPYHPYRKVGDKFYNISRIYDWEGKHNDGEQPPLSAWRGAVEFDLPNIISWIVDSVTVDGLIVHEHRNSTRGDTYDDPPFFLTNYPAFKSIAENEKIRFLALRNGIYRFTDTDGSGRSIECWDYGTPLTLEQFRAGTSGQ